MMIFRMIPALGLALAILAGPTTARAQQGAPAPEQAAPSPQMQALVGELQQLNGRLQELQQKALEDPELDAAQEALGSRIKTAMEEADPTLERSLARIEELETQAAAAQEAGDVARLQQLGAEAEQIQAQFATAQQKALARPELAAEIQAFQGRLQAKMAELEPEAPRLIARFQELQEKLVGAMQGAEQG